MTAPDTTETAPDTTNGIACVILNWNGGARIQRCLQSLHDSRDVIVRSVVVDNGSTDGSIGVLRRSFPSTDVIEMKRNVGLARGRNEGVRWALVRGYRHVLFIDDDATVSEDTLSHLKKVLDASPEGGLVTPRIFDGNRPGLIWYDGGVVNLFGDPVHRRGGGGRSSGAPEEVTFATGCCSMIARAVFDRIGLLDGDFFVYSEDVDFSFRARAAGFLILHDPDAHAWHEQSSDTKANRGKWFRDYYVTRNKLLLFRKHYRRWRRLTANVFLICRWLAIPSLYFFLRLDFDRMKALGQAVNDYRKNRFGERFT